MSNYTELWDRPPFEAPSWGRRMSDLDNQLPAPLALDGWHFRAWNFGWDPWYLYAPDGVLVGRWETEPSYSELYDVYRAWVARKGST